MFTIHTWISLVCLLVLTVPFAANTTPDVVQRGLWVKSDGQTISMLCPAKALYANRALKLPQTCRTEQAGVWLSVDSHTALKAENAKLKAELDKTKEALAIARLQLANERSEISNYFKTTASKLELIESGLSQDRFSWGSAGIGLATGLTFCGGVWLGGAF